MSQENNIRVKHESKLAITILEESSSDSGCVVMYLISMYLDVAEENHTDIIGRTETVLGARKGLITAV